MASSYSFANTFKSYFTHTLYQEERNYIYSFLPSILLDHVTLKSDSLPKYQFLCKKLPFLWHHRLSSRYNYKLTENKTGHVTVWPMTNWPFDRLTIISLHTWKSYLFCTHGHFFAHMANWPCAHVYNWRSENSVQLFSGGVASWWYIRSINKRKHLPFHWRLCS